MLSKTWYPFFSLLVVLTLVSVACSSSAAPESTPTDTPAPATATNTAVPSSTPKPTNTPRPSKTPNLAATQRQETLDAEAKKYFDMGYLASADGRFIEYDDFKTDWAQLGWYNWWILDEKASDFFMSAHFSWSTAWDYNDVSGCGFVFAIQDNSDHYAVFLDKSRILFLNSDQSRGGSYEVGKTKGTGRVKFGNPAEADFTLIIKEKYAIVLVDGEMVGEYTLAKDKAINGNLGLTVLSGTNRDYGTRCEMTNLHIWLPK